MACALFNHNLTIEPILKSVFRVEGLATSSSTATIFEKVIITDNTANESVEFFPYSGKNYRGTNRTSESINATFTLGISIPQALRDKVYEDPNQNYTEQETGKGVTLTLTTITGPTTVCKGIVDKIIHSDETIEYSKRFLYAVISLPVTGTVYLQGDYYYRQRADCLFTYKGTESPHILELSNFSLPTIPTYTSDFPSQQQTGRLPYTPPGEGE